MTDIVDSKAKAALAYLMDHIVYSDSYGVHGSDFAACRLCNGGGAPGVPLVHEETCPAARYGDVAQEWWDERDQERKEAADEIERLRAVAQSAWQPIASAPKMKTLILFAVTDIGDDGSINNWKMATGSWHTGYESNEKYSPWTWDGRQLYKYEIQPTHWMPLPEAPALPSAQCGGK